MAMSGFGNLQPGYVEPITGATVTVEVVNFVEERRNHRLALDEAFEVEPCPACSGSGRAHDEQGWDIGHCKTCWGLKDVPLTYEQYRATVCEQFAADIDEAMSTLSTTLEAHCEQLYPDEAMIALAKRAQQAAENAAKAWRASPDRRTTMQAVAAKEQG